MEIAVNKFDEIRNFVFDRLSRTSIENFYWNDDEGENLDLTDAAARMGAEDCDWGATKVVLYFQEMKEFVVKIPFMGSCTFNEDGDIDWNSCFSGGYGDGAWDYCVREAEVYELAEEEGIEDMLCGTWFLGWYQQHPIYISERAEQGFYTGNDKIEYTDKNNSQATARKICDNFESRSFGYTVDSRMIDCYGYDKLKKLFAFLDREEINDCHSGNFMWKDNKVKLIDYSGYDE